MQPRLAIKGNEMRILTMLAYVLLVAPAAAADCPDEDLIYRQDAEQATGIAQVLPLAPADSAIADFREFPFMDWTINGQSKRYSTTSGGTGIRTRGAYIDGQDGSTIAYTTYDVAGRVAEGQPDHFVMIDGELYWPECAADTPTAPAASTSEPVFPEGAGNVTIVAKSPIQPAGNGRARAVEI